MKKHQALILSAICILAAAIVTVCVIRGKKETQDFSWKDFDKTYFAFVLDDTNEYTAPIYQVFHERNVPLSAAAITGMLDTQAVGIDGTITDVLRLIVSDGGEVLAHYSGNLADPGYTDGDFTFETDDASWREKTIGTKEKLEALGFTVRGVIRADYSQSGSKKGESICREAFEYSDGLGISTQYAMKRTFLLVYPTVESFEEWIDECCAKPGFYPICFHGWETIGGPEDVAAILDYILEKYPGQAVLTTYADVYDRFGQLKK